MQEVTDKKATAINSISPQLNATKTTTWTQEKTQKQTKTRLSCDHESSLVFCKKARIPGKVSPQLNIVISLKKARLCLLAVL